MSWFSILPHILYRLAGVALTVGGVGTLYIVCALVYNAFLHPLRKYPGPKLWAVSRLPYARAVISGKSHLKILEFHQKYGDIIRIAPNELSFVDPKAWDDIMGHRKHGQGENGKDPIPWKSQKYSVISANRENHARMRRSLSRGFSAASMIEQQPLIQGYVDVFISKLRSNCRDGTAALEMTSWYNWVTFDIIGDLAFGEPFGCLETTSYHPWVALIFDRIRGSAINTVLRRFPCGAAFAGFITPRKVIRNFHDYFKITQEKVDKRLKSEVQRHDFMEAMAHPYKGQQMSHPEILDNASLLVIAGSETTATTLSAVTYLLATNPNALTAVTAEVRGAFATEEEIDLLSVQKLTYMLAVLNECLRIYPPVPTAIPRKAQPGGDTICGQYVPEDTVLGIWQWAMYRSSKNFVAPDSFIPERWLDASNAGFANDNKDAFQPFSFGPRNCLGRNLAFAEMRLILAKVLWNFDIRTDSANTDWIDRSNTYTLWQKPELFVYLTPRSAGKSVGTAVTA